MSEAAEDLQQEIETSPYHDLINHALNQDFNKANEIFGDMMTVKMSDMLDQEKIKLAGQIYNGEVKKAGLFFYDHILWAFIVGLTAADYLFLWGCFLISI